MSDRPKATPIVLTQLLTTNLDEHGRGWNCRVTMERASGPYGQQRLHLGEPDLATDQKVGGSSPSKRAQFSGRLRSCGWSRKVPGAAAIAATTLMFLSPLATVRVS
jgi:hypothetical protein